MPDFSTPKGVAKWMKVSKGLQKLRWYCQVCQKQCRDENGFQNHIRSESHLRNMKIVGNNPGKFIGQNSRAFERGFISILQSRYVNRKVFANKVYQEYIADKNHVHMNGTCWSSLNQFVQTLVSNGICEVEDTERGPYITYIKHDEEGRRRKQRELELAKSSLDEQERQLKHFEEEHERMVMTMDKSQLEYTKADDVDLGKTISLNNLNLVTVEPKKEEVKVDKRVDFDSLLGIKPEEKKDDVVKSEGSHNSSRDVHHTRERSRERSYPKAPTIQIHLNEFSYLQKENHKDHWLVPGLEVKIMNSQLGNGLSLQKMRFTSRLYKKKGKVVSLFDAYTAKVKPYESDFSIRIDQDELQTVIPKEGEMALVVNGPLVKEHVKIVKINKEEDYCEAEVASGEHKGKKVRKMYYDDICKESAA
ncbi:DNA/RNA-binding protein KIN17 [Blastocystis sp. ATCC 50177/Nand II]|uniref:DNA/RNA-binding protein KIN17 n=1 Tax=Blastocystis sp. subtype 1 (strain ATCC 50177 / NandII) TaxID=478820 RepID=A0A196S8X9_BLAHN|nr:DNA/RNA-binding protein KIN17 [Blastocystis sp. ATCC 50177/Nand II]